MKSAAVPGADRRRPRRHRRRAGPGPPPHWSSSLPVTAVSQALQAVDAGAAEGHRAGDQGRPRLGTLRPVEEAPELGHASTRTSRRRATARARSPSCARSAARVLGARRRPAAVVAERRATSPRDVLTARAWTPRTCSAEAAAETATTTSPTCLPGYEAMTIPQLRGKLRYARASTSSARCWSGRPAHGNRPPFVTMLTNRIATVNASPDRGVTTRRRPAGAAVAGPHGRAQDRRVDRPARRGVGGGPARPGHRPARARAPRSSCCATRPRTCRCS